MKRITYIALAAILSISAVSCTKVIDVKLDNTEPAVVIEGSITDVPGPHTITVTQTTNVDKNNNFPPVTGATVTLTDNSSVDEVLTEVSPGVYQTSALAGVPGKTYTLTVTVNGKTYAASSTMPQKVPFDSLGLKELQTPGGKELFPVVYYTDPKGIGNSYRAVEYINGEKVDEMFIETDEFIDGKTREAVLFTRGDEYDLHSNDLVEVEVLCIDKNVYKYFEELSEVSGSSDIAAPANPSSNISNGALGYFSAHTIQKRTLVYP